MRMILTVSGARWWAALLGFVELLIWVLAVGGVVTNLGSPIIVVAYAGAASGGVHGHPARGVRPRQHGGGPDRVIRRRSLRRVRETVQRVARRAFISVERADRPLAAASSDIPALPRRGLLRGLTRK